MAASVLTCPPAPVAPGPKSKAKAKADAPPPGVADRDRPLPRPTPRVSTIFDLMADPVLSPSAKVIGYYLQWRARPNADCWPTDRQIEAGTGISHRSIRLFLAELEAAGWIGRYYPRSERDRLARIEAMGFVASWRAKRGAKALAPPRRVLICCWLLPRPGEVCTERAIMSARPRKPARPAPQAPPAGPTEAPRSPDPAPHEARAGARFPKPENLTKRAPAATSPTSYTRVGSSNSDALNSEARENISISVVNPASDADADALSPPVPGTGTRKEAPPAPALDPVAVYQAERLVKRLYTDYHHAVSVAADGSIQLVPKPGVRAQIIRSAAESLADDSQIQAALRALEAPLRALVAPVVKSPVPTPADAMAGRLAGLAPGLAPGDLVALARDLAGLVDPGGDRTRDFLGSVLADSARGRGLPPAALERAFRRAFGAPNIKSPGRYFVRTVSKLLRELRAGGPL